MRKSFKVGVSFGLTSGAITTMGVMVGLFSGTHSLKAVLGGMLTIAVADAISDSLAMHIHEESEDEHSPREIWESTFATFISKFLFSLTFIIPLLVFPINLAVVISLAWGLSAIAFLSHKIATEQKGSSVKAIREHILTALLVILVTYAVGAFVAGMVE